MSAHAVWFAIAATLTTPLTWNGITLGEPVSSLRPALGDPLRIVASPDGSLHAARYWIAGSNATFVIVLEKRGVVEAFHAFVTEMEPEFANVPPDPSGVRLGDTLQSVKTVHPGFRMETTDDGATQLVGRVGDTGVDATYEFKDGRVRSFQWTQPVADEAPAHPSLTMPAGDSPGTAILDMQKDERSGVEWEYMYLAFTPCDGDARWKTQQQSLVNSGGHAFDRLHVICPATKAERDFYFNIDAYFGKL
jgi:hypothetical protein